MKGLRVKVLALAVALATALAVGLTSSGAVTSGTVGTTDLKNGAVTSDKIRNYTIEAIDIAHHAIGSSELKNHSVGNAEIAANAITSGLIKNGEVKTKDLAKGAVTTDKLAASFAIDAGNIKAGAVTSAQILDGTITPSDLSTSVLSLLTDTGDVVTNPSSTQKITYGAAGVGTVLTMAGGATADPLEIQNSAGGDVFAVGTDGSLTTTGGISTDAGALTSDGFGDLTVNTLTSDNGAISTDGLGNLTVGGWLSTDGGNITSDGSGNLVVNGDLHDWGGNYFEGSDTFGNSLTLDGGGLLIYGTNNDGNYLDIGGGALTVDGNGTLSVENLKVSGVDTFTSNATALNATDTITAADMLTNKIVTVATGGGTLTTDSAANIVAADPTATAGDTFTFLLSNNNSSGEVLAPGSGVTFDNVGNLSAFRNLTVECVITDTGTPAVTCFGAGTVNVVT